MSNNIDSFLEHYGVLGMHWGFHKPENNKPQIKKPKAKKKSLTLIEQASKMTDEDLKKRISRMNLELNYVDITKKKSDSGKNSVNSFLAKKGKTAFDQAAQKNLTKVVELAMAALVGYGIKKIMRSKGL